MSGSQARNARDRADSSRSITRSRLDWYITILILIAGIAIRLIQYLTNRSLWTDEAMLAWNILERNPSELLLPLNYHQASPVLFLLIVDFLTSLFGGGEPILRLVPLLSSIAALGMFFLAARILLDRTLVPVAVFVFAFSKPMVYFAQELKQYSTDAVVSVGLFYMFTRSFHDDRSKAGTLVVPVIAGSFFLFLSHTSIFVITASFLVLLAMKLHDRTHHSRASILCAGGVWGIAFAINFRCFLTSISSDNYLASYWSGVFLPLPTHLTAISTWIKAPFEFFSYMGFAHGSQVIPVGLALVSIVTGLRTRVWPVILITVVLVLSGIASMLHIYPICGRLSIFLIPLSILLAVKGAERIPIIRSTFGFLLVAGLLVTPVCLSGLPYLHSPIVKEEIRPLLDYCAFHRSPGDHLYIHRSAMHVVRYYLRNDPELLGRIQIGSPEKPDRSNLGIDVREMKRHQRVWMLFGYSRKGEDRLILSASGADPIESHHETGAVLHLLRFDPSNDGDSWTPSRKKTILATLKSP